MLKRTVDAEEWRFYGSLNLTAQKNKNETLERTTGEQESG